MQAQEDPNFKANILCDKFKGEHHEAAAKKINK